MQLISDGLFFSNDVRRPFHDSTFGWTLQRRRRRIQRCRSHPTLLPQLTGPFPRSSSAWGFGYVYTFLPRTFIVVLVGVLVYCVPIPTSHYSVPFSRSTFSLAALSWEKR